MHERFKLIRLWLCFLIEWFSIFESLKRFSGVLLSVPVYLNYAVPFLFICFRLFVHLVKVMKSVNKHIRKKPCLIYCCLGINNACINFVFAQWWCMEGMFSIVCASVAAVKQKKSHVIIIMTMLFIPSAKSKMFYKIWIFFKFELKKIGSVPFTPS